MWTEYWHGELTKNAMSELVKNGLYDGATRKRNKINKGIGDYHATIIAEGNMATDSGAKSAVFSQGRHLNRNTVGDSREDWGEKLLAQAIDAWKTAENIYDYYVRFFCADNNEPAILAMHEERKNALRLLGEGLHSIQDIDAHLNVGLDTPLYVVKYHQTMDEDISLGEAYRREKVSKFDNPFYDITETKIPIVNTVQGYTYTVYQYEHVAIRVPVGEGYSKRYTDSLDRSMKYLKRFYSAVDTAQKMFVEF